MIRSQKGQATVELALSLTILLFLLFGIIDFGRIFHSYLTLEHAGREAARVASVGGTDAQIHERISAAAPTLTSSAMNVSISPSKGSRSRGTYVTVHLSYPVTFSIPLFKEILPETVVLQSKTVMRIE
ncbi:TadE/TadG family type IV pilus assembly protein [Anaerobacillus sp. MEB173]|uniref:TadE/TadG family type IV pilus assembly protein n=1 Tax=Anaerobacillus sp. MEB173 TaxID=3383345 RepID=UPI003F9228D9